MSRAATEVASFLEAVFGISGVGLLLFAVVVVWIDPAKAAAMAIVAVACLWAADHD